MAVLEFDVADEAAAPDANTWPPATVVLKDAFGAASWTRGPLELVPTPCRASLRLLTHPAIAGLVRVWLVEAWCLPSGGGSCQRFIGELALDQAEALSRLWQREGLAVERGPLATEPVPISPAALARIAATEIRVRLRDGRELIL